MHHTSKLRSPTSNIYRGHIDTTAPVPYAHIDTPTRTPKASSLNSPLSYSFHLLIQRIVIKDFTMDRK